MSKQSYTDIKEWRADHQNDRIQADQVSFRVPPFINFPIAIPS